jgi:uncharacterized protein with HEPN domain
VNPIEQRQRVIIDDMLQYLDTIADVVKRGRESFFDSTDVRNRATVEHYLELLGEGSKALGEPFQNANPGVQWSSLARFRFDIAHPYDTKSKPVSYEEMWRFAVSDLPKIARRLRNVRFPKYLDHKA